MLSYASAGDRLVRKAIARGLIKGPPAKPRRIPIAGQDETSAPFPVFHSDNKPVYLDTTPVGALSFGTIARAVCARFEVERAQLYGTERAIAIVRPRQVAFYLARKHKRVLGKPASFPEIGRRFGGKDHTTVLHGCRQVERLIASDAYWAATVEEIERELGVS